MEDLVVEEVEVVLEVAKVCFYHFLIDWAHGDHSAGYFTFCCEKSGHSRRLYACAAGEQHISLLCEHHFLKINLKLKLRMAVAGWIF